MSVITPFGVDTIAIPNPLFILGKLSALEKILRPGLDTLSKLFITGFKTINTNSELEAIQLFEKQYLKYSIKSLNLDIAGIKKMEVDNGTNA